MLLRGGRWVSRQRRVAILRRVVALPPVDDLGGHITGGLPCSREAGRPANIIECFVDGVAERLLEVVVNLLLVLRAEAAGYGIFDAIADQIAQRVGNDVCPTDTDDAFEGGIHGAGGGCEQRDASEDVNHTILLAVSDTSCDNQRYYSTFAGRVESGEWRVENGEWRMPGSRAGVRAISANVRGIEA